MDIIFMISENRKTSDSFRLLFNIADKINFNRGDKYVALSNLGMNYTWKVTKKFIHKQ